MSNGHDECSWIPNYKPKGILLLSPYGGIGRFSGAADITLAVPTASLYAVRRKGRRMFMEEGLTKPYPEPARVNVSKLATMDFSLLGSDCEQTCVGYEANAGKRIFLRGAFALY